MRGASTWLYGVLLCAAASCGPAIGQPGDDASAGSSDDGSTGMTGPSSLTSVGEDTTAGPGPSTSVGPATTVSDATDTIDPSVSDATDTSGPVCPQTENFTCTGQVGCDGRPCADNPMSPFDDNGCLRPQCPCEAGMVCFTPADWGGCVGSEIFCADENGQCQCGGTDDCGGSYCLPEGDAPTAACGSIIEETECLDAGCSAFVQGRPITDRGGGACLCDLEEPWCLWIDPGATALPNPAAYVSAIDGRVLVFEATWDPPPFGWIACAGMFEPPPECACAEVLPCAMGGG